MTLTMEQWKEILNSNEGDILEQIKAKLKEQDKNIYQKWKRGNFNLNRSFGVPLDSQFNTQLQIIERFTLLELAAYHGYLDIVKYLVKDKNVNTNQVYKNYHNTALHWAARNGHLETVKYLAAVVLKVNRKIDVAVNKYLKFVWAYLFTAMLLLYRSSFRAIPHKC